MIINSFVTGGLIGLVGDNSRTGNTNSNQVKLISNNFSGSLKVNGYVTGGTNQGEGSGSSLDNSVLIEVSSGTPAAIQITQYVLGGLVSKASDGKTNNNNVTISIADKGQVNIEGYVGGGAYQGSGISQSNGNTVLLEGGLEQNLININQYVFGGLIEKSASGETSKNIVSIKNAHVSQYIAGGYNQGLTQVSANENEVYLEGVSLKDPTGTVDGRFIVGALVEAGKGDVNKNKVTLVDSAFTGKYIAGGVSQGTSQVEGNEITLINSNVEGFVAAGLDWYGKDVTLVNNKVTVEGGSVVGRIAGARSWTGQNVNDNTVSVKNAEIKAGGEYKGHVLGAANQSGGNALRNHVLVENSHVEGYVAGGFIEHYEGGLNNGSTDDNDVTLINTNVDNNIGGGYNQAGGTLSASNNTVLLKILPSSTANSFKAGGFIAGGIIGEKQKGTGNTNDNTVNILVSGPDSRLEIAGYVAGGYNGGVGEGGASGNSVVINTPATPSGSDFSVTVGTFVLGGFIGSELKTVSPSGDTNNNTVSINNALVTSYIAGGYNLGKKGNANQNQISLQGVKVYGGQDISGHFIAGGVIGEEGQGDANNNTVSVSDSHFKGKYLAGGVNQGNGLVNANVTILTNTHVEGFVAGGLDWGENGNVTLTNNVVKMIGGSVSTVPGTTSTVPGESITGRVVGARSIGIGDVVNNSVYLKNVTIEDGVRGGVVIRTGNSLQNVITIEDSKITGWTDNGTVKGGSVVAGYLEAGGSGDTNENSVLMKNTEVKGNIVGGFNQALGSSNSRNNKVLFQIDSSSSGLNIEVGGFIAGGITGSQSEGAADNNSVVITNSSGVTKTNVKGYVAGGYNDGNGLGTSSGNSVLVEAVAKDLSGLTVENFVIGGYMRTGEGNTNNNLVQLNNVFVKGTSSYVAGGLNEGTGQAVNNIVNLANTVVQGGVLGGRVTGGSSASVATDAPASSLQHKGQEEGKYIALVKNNIITISDNTKVYGRIAGGESLVGTTDKDGLASVIANKIFVDSGYVEGDIYGGLSVKANVSDNVINLNGGRIKGAVYGGFSLNGNVVTGNIVNLNGAHGIDLTEAWLFGRRRVTDGADGNTLNIVNYKGEMENMGNFDRIDLNLSGLKISVDSPIILLTEKLPTNLDNSTIHIHSNNLPEAVTSDPALADRIEIIKNQSGVLTAYSVKFEKDKIVVTQDNGPLTALYSVEWDGSADKTGDSIDLVKSEVFERPEAGSYIANSEAWAKMHMRLHDRFGHAYYIDPFDGLEKSASGWVRQVGSHAHFKSGSSTKTHSKTAVTQVGADLLRDELNKDWKYIGGVFAGGLYNRSNTRSFGVSKSRTDGYSLGIYGTVYSGNSPDDGFYVDSWLLFGNYNNKIWGEETPGFKYKSHGWVWSIESGYTIPLTQSGEKDFNKLIWTFQPEVQFIWDGVKANNVSDNIGTKYRQLGKDNVSIRVGARIHANHMNKGLGFIEGNWIHNTKQAGVQMGEGKVWRNGARNIGEFRMGLEGHLSRNLLGWATVGFQAGKSGYHRETAQIGFRYMF